MFVGQALYRPDTTDDDHDHEIQKLLSLLVDDHVLIDADEPAQVLVKPKASTAHAIRVNDNQGVAKFSVSKDGQVSTHKVVAAAADPSLQQQRQQRQLSRECD